MKKKAIDFAAVYRPIHAAGLMKKMQLTGRWNVDRFRRVVLGVLFCWIAMLTAAYADTVQNGMPAHQILKLGVLPDSSPEMIKQRFSPLMRYLERKAGIRIELLIPTDYRELVRQFTTKKIDMAFFGGYTFVMTQRETKAVPLIMRDIDLNFSTVFLTHPNNTKQKIEDFKGERFSFGDALSTSGHVMPRYFLHNRNIRPEKFFSEVRYSGGHDTTAFWVRDNQVDLGAANSDIIKNMIKDGLLNKNDVRILWETPVYTNYVFAIQPDFDKELRGRLLDSFLALTPRVQAHQEILTALGTSGFLPANNEDFEILRKAVKIMAPQ
ncbi:phosphate/phosphite/phosphonate ABC transporter substrate-binding protein [Nitrosomonas aestuarii]|uniref:phosphate/phosphite/phosphonate ABC transporter substrate-binding protein n=1 Tax=Nitrosomonas aestuarii TaxID=52441 RepID=UPI0015E7B2F6|nr:phosphate/phosphite/phosphonate ABC transporter substrate-binding protein [Nitrosomonas aestuarii]